jgi:glycosyltransferase involved in cell wall biosynthesis
VPEGGGGAAFRDALQDRFGPVLGSRLTLAGPEFDPVRLARRYAAMDIFCYPSTDRGETFGVAVAEAMAAGCAPVVSELACFRELVQPGENGLAFAHAGPAPAAALAVALEQLLRDAPFRRRLAERARAHAHRYDFAASADALLGYLARFEPDASVAPAPRGA